MYNDLTAQTYILSIQIIVIRRENDIEFLLLKIN